MKKVLFIFGTRPEALKLAPVYLAMKEQEDFEAGICITAQHREMLDQVLRIFDIVPDYDLDLMKPSQDLADLTARALEKISGVLDACRPDWVVVQGDTTSSFAAALAAFYRRIPVAHVEAGLRSGRLDAPWPEEMNRRLTAVMTSLHFAPTPRARSNLLREGHAEQRIHVTGNTIIDTLDRVTARLQSDLALVQSLEKQFANIPQDRKLVLVTGHRRESFGAGLESVCRALATLAETNDISIVYPVHLNPRVQAPARRILEASPNVYLMEPLEYIPFVYLLTRSAFIISDSGGVQEEAPSLGKPVLVTRDVTERMEAVDAGAAVLVGTDPRRIVGEAQKLLDDEAYYLSRACVQNPFGDGKASGRIVARMRAQT
ncbi:MAG: UDP-N-acetylglucosamine 2-epimerase (non-hydrolyzing) [Acidobacteria bacterium]|nr:UDP-N-acetylglucosamine 2-epimerase (non-hydrolyzing) [Acidobacteriota bacterium]